jgi:hypothetical protein
LWGLGRCAASEALRQVLVELGDLVGIGVFLPFRPFDHLLDPVAGVPIVINPNPAVEGEEELLATPSRGLILLTQAALSQVLGACSKYLRLDEPDFLMDGGVTASYWFGDLTPK